MNCELDASAQCAASLTNPTFNSAWDVSLLGCPAVVGGLHCRPSVEVKTVKTGNRKILITSYEDAD